MRQRGFTLLEMLIGITLLGLLMVLVYGGLRLGTQSWEAGEAAAEVTARQAAVAEYLRRQLAQVYPLRWSAGDGTETLAFVGEADGLRFAAPVAARMAPGGVHLVALAAEPDGEAKALRLHWRPPDPEHPAFEFGAEDGQAVVVRGIEAVEFAYYGAETEDAEPDWHAAWHSEARLPRLIRLRLRPAQGEPWPDIVAALRLDAEAACRWDPFYKRCL